jgi:hypothetical protein
LYLHSYFDAKSEVDYKSQKLNFSLFSLLIWLFEFSI